MAKRGIPAIGISHDWQAEDDARTLALAEEIKRDAKRLKAAGEKAAKMRDEHKEKAKDMHRIAQKHGLRRMFGGKKKAG